MRFLTFGLIIAFAAAPVFAKGYGTSVGLTLLQPTGARSSALGEAVSALEDDIASMSSNPAGLGTLSSGHTTFLYEKGLFEDSFGFFSFGLPTATGGLGFSFGTYNGGDFEHFQGDTPRTITAKTDLFASLGYAHKIGRISMGLAGKYLSSELVEADKATAMAADIGVMLPLGDRMTLGFAAQNFGSKLKYLEEGYNLPRLARAGFAVDIVRGSYLLRFLADVPYYLNEAEIQPGAGLEYLVGPLALRAGYKEGSEQQNFVFGAGFFLSRMSLDYSYGLVQDLDAAHKASLSLRFGQERQPTIAHQSPPSTPLPKAEAEVRFVQNDRPVNKEVLGRRLGNQVYIVQPGDSLGIIAKKMYGDKLAWKQIYQANEHLIIETKSLRIGQKLVLP